MLGRLVKTLMGWEEKPNIEKDLIAHKWARMAARIISPLPIPLWTLLRAFGSDKHQPGLHSYGHTYDALFRRWKYRRVTLLEIGIGGYGGSMGGQSLLAWQAYFPFGAIVAADIVPKQALTGGSARVHTVDQSSAADLAALRAAEGPFDIIIDDGSHMNAHQIFTFQEMWGALRDGGVYIVEDVQTSFWPGTVNGVAWDGAFIDDAAFRGVCAGYFLELAKYVNHAEFMRTAGVDAALLAIGKQVRRICFEHNIIVIEKGDNEEVSNVVAGASPLV